MSNVWGTRYRLLVERLEERVEWLSGEEPLEPEKVEEQGLRLLNAAVALLRQHEVNKRGQCQFCGWTRWKWRFWRARPRCTVFRALDRAMGQGMDVVWWELFNGVGREVGLDEVRGWVKGRASDTPGAVSDETFHREELGDTDVMETTE